jgi:hypothetical protein
VCFNLVPLLLISLVSRLIKIGLIYTGACSSVALAGFALPECPGSSPHVYPAHEGLTAVVYRGLVPPPSRVRPFMCTPVTPAVPYLLLGLQDVQWAVGNSRGARKLARTPHVNQKKKKKNWANLFSPPLVRYLFVSLTH